MSLVPLLAPLEIKHRDGVIDLTLWLCDPFDYGYSFREAIRQIEQTLARSGPTTCSLPSHDADEDFVEGELVWGSRVFSIYFEHALGCLSFSSRSLPDVQELQAAIAADPGRPSQRRLRHVIVVAGPSGAGKNAFIEQLVSGEMQPDVLAALQLRPREALLVAELDHALWMPRVFDLANGRTLVMHYDMTHTGLAFSDGFERDPAFQILRMAEMATLVNLRPPHDRLLQQWGAAHLNAGSLWQIRLKRWLDVLGRAIERAIRRTPRATHRPRFLWRAASRISKRWQMPHRRLCSLYLQRDGLERLYRSWDAFVRQAEGWTQLRQVDVQPDPTSAVGAKAMRWRIDERAKAVRPDSADKHSVREEPAAVRPA